MNSRQRCRAAAGSLGTAALILGATMALATQPTVLTAAPGIFARAEIAHIYFSFFFAHIVFLYLFFGCQSFSLLVTPNSCPPPMIFSPWKTLSKRISLSFERLYR